MYYSATLFGLVGFTNPTAVSITVGATNFIFTLVNLAIIDRVGRRLILLVTVIGMVREPIHLHFLRLGTQS